MLQLEVLILELVTIDGLATSAIVVGEITSLAHELRDDTMESGSLVTETALASAQSPEVLSGTGHNVSAELCEFKTPKMFIMKNVNCFVSICTTRQYKSNVTQT